MEMSNSEDTAQYFTVHPIYQTGCLSHMLNAIPKALSVIAGLHV